LVLAAVALAAADAEAALDPPDVTYDPVLAESLEHITDAGVRDIVGGLTGEWPITVDGARRWLTARSCCTAPEGNPASGYVREWMERQGLTTSYWSTWEIGRDVLAVREGEGRPSEIILVLAHLDADGGWPGADDNASGSAGVMLAAQALGRHRFERTIRFFLSGRENRGSARYAQRMVDQGENLVAVINLDMIGNDDGLNRAKIFTVGPEAPTYADETTIAQCFVDAIGAYSLGLTPFIDESCG
jgi:acetylornithine deacetylase/succinyl-diaminopimelate desuccinylase-like protein